MNTLNKNDLIAIEREARQMQAQFVADSIRGAARWVVGLFARPAVNRTA